MQSDRHLHSKYSVDSKEEPENSVKRALELGMESLCFTDHYDIDFPGGAFSFDVDKYFRELTDLKEKYKGQIDILIGVELGLQPNIEDKLQNFLSRYPFQFVVGSVHLIGDKDPYYRREFNVSDREFLRSYLEVTYQCVKNCSGFDTLGHIDYVIRYAYQRDKCYTEERFGELTHRILSELVKRDIALEINTAPLRKELPYPHPYPFVLKQYKALGGKKLTYGSDAHKSEQIGFGFLQAEQYVKDIFKEDS